MESLPVLITGTSSGIGKATALHLSSQGFTVFAGVRKNSDGETLRREGEGKLIPLLLDVTNQESVNASVEKIAEYTGSNLFALINNAGMFFGGPLEILSFSDIQKLFNVNVTGVLAVTKAVIPLLRNNGEGRIINIGSATGFFPTPGLSVYCASKYGLRGLTDALRLELYPFNIRVSLMEIGSIDTPIWNKGLAFGGKTFRNIDEDILKLYTPLIDFQKNLMGGSRETSPQKVAKKIFQILETKNPKNRYLIGTDTRIVKLVTMLPSRLLDRIILWFMPKFKMQR
jgi:NAD(P)-dependent dehydrogenase (short-subunit alcohol dehydrogenase family)